MPNLQSWESRFFITEILGAIFNTIALHTGGWGELKIVLLGRTLYSQHIGILTDRCFTYTGVQTCIVRFLFKNRKFMFCFDF
jgi:hypothetical protein